MKFNASPLGFLTPPPPSLSSNHRPTLFLLPSCKTTKIFLKARFQDFIVLLLTQPWQISPPQVKVKVWCPNPIWDCLSEQNFPLKFKTSSSSYLGLGKWTHPWLKSHFDVHQLQNPFKIVCWKKNSNPLPLLTSVVASQHAPSQGGRSWQHFGERKNDHKNFRQTRVYYFATTALFLRVIANLHI